MVRQVQPLRISKNTPSSSPNKMQATSRPLAEIGSTERRRNSPSYNQATRKQIVSRESSPYTENSFTENSPPPSLLNKLSPSTRDFWSSKKDMSPSRFDSENTPEPRSPSPSLNSSQRRSSIEKLKQASRVKNSNIFALETKDAYDPSSLPIVERPSANRPLSQSFVNNSFTRFDSLRKENTPLRSPQQSPSHKRSQTETHIDFFSPTKAAAGVALPDSPTKHSSPSPTKSALARTSQFWVPNSFDPENGAWSDEERVPTPRALHRHAKSVTWHEEPPVINEYEQQTPEPSVSVASDREGSWDSDDFYDQDISFDRGSSAEVRDDSFDADLENADKTPVVLPEYWSRMSPDEARTDLVNGEDDVFNNDDVDESTQRLHAAKFESNRVASDSSETRPLPPLPGFMARDRRDSNNSLSSAAERAAQTPRALPTAPKRASCSKEEILKMTSQSSLTLQDRLQLMGNTHEERPTSSKSSASTVHETEQSHHEEEELVITNLDTGEKVEIATTVTEQEVQDEDSVLGDLASFAPPRISRESILRKVRGAVYDDLDAEEEEDQEYSELIEESEYRASIDEEGDGRPTIAELARMDPDQPVPSRENSRETSEEYMYLSTAYAASAYVEDQEPAEVLEEEEEVKIKAEPSDEEEGVDMSAIPPMLAPPQSLSALDDHDRQSSVLRHDVPRDAGYEDEDDDADSASRYSSVSDGPDAESTIIQNTTTTTHQETVTYDEGKETLQEAMQLLTVKDYSQPEPATQTKQGGEFQGLPAYLSTDDWLDFGMKEYITPSPPAVSSESPQKKLQLDTMPQLQPPANIQQVQQAYVDEEISPPGTPNSVIHNSSSDFNEEEGRNGAVSPIEAVEHNSTILPPLTSRHEEHHSTIIPPPQEQNKRDSDPIIPDRMASIKTPGGKLKTRPSASRADLEQMAQQRRVVSADYAPPPVPAMPTDFQSDAGAEAERPESSSSGSVASKEKQPARKKSRKSGGRMDLDLGLDTSAFSFADHDGLGLDEEFERVIEGQKVGEDAFTAENDAGANGASSRSQKGYLMRQNTKIVVASNRNFSGDSDGTLKAKANSGSDETPMSPTTAAAKSSSRGTRSANSSPRKPSAEQFLKTEPWNGKTRRKSLRNASAVKDAYTREPAPPLPGQQSALGVVDEDYAAGSANLDEDVGEGVERGRLFAKVVGVKDLDLPMPRSDRVEFQLTLDNGLHCVTTTSLELGKSAPIGQEFELVVLNDLEFQLTLTTKLPPPPSNPSPIPSSPTKSVKAQKQSGFSRFLSSPKKRAEKERLEREAVEAEERRYQQELQRKRASHVPTTWDLLHNLVDNHSGSFARAYVNLKAHEKACFGRAVTVDVPCYNEWAQEQDQNFVNSVRSKRGAQNGPVRRPPYVVGLLELQLLYVPKPRGGGEEYMPKSMSSAVREMGRAREAKEVGFEGCLSQQGGDCAHWRRRFFRLAGPKLTAYHEHTHQKRAVINLTKASRLVDDKSTLVADPSPSKVSKGRRKSAFAEEDEGYAYVEEGFRIRFANGETIDFYADSREAKEEWMVVLAQVVGKADEKGKEARWTDLVLARERAGGLEQAAAEPASPVKQSVGGVDARDFIKGNLQPGRQDSYARKPVASNTAMPKPSSKSAPNSPMKGLGNPAPSTAAPESPTKALRNPAPSTAAPAARPRTPPMKPRTGHRSREAVKSMIF
ncbi:Bud site selection protein bud4 [Vermiconidia calcicola]|uniref:Bud site selection protein bud4 n=1 Tax=Vermiconidia calcicola TaxID=1690605 RepID=A0ACC3NK00_9PEZI|nr:Bud site selection protein bud4 [Vermiconidia calcicola]